MRPPWKRRTPEGLAARGDVRRLLAALQPRARDFIEESSGVFDVGWQRRAEAARHLAGQPGEMVTQALVAALGDVTPAVRLEALRSAATRGDAPDDRLVSEVLHWPEADARAAAEPVLRERAARAPATATHMLEAYAATQGAEGVELSGAWVGEVARAAGGAGVHGCVERTAPAALARAPRAVQVLLTDPEHAVARLVPHLSEEETRLATIELLGRLRDHAATASLLEQLEHHAADVRAAAATALGEIKDPRAIDALLRHTADDDYDVRDAALGALDGFGTAAIVWGLASVARGVLTSVTGDDWLRELEPGDAGDVPQLPLVQPEHVDAESHEVTEPELQLAEPRADQEGVAARRRRGFWR